jgi:hypothetical protein
MASRLRGYRSRVRVYCVLGRCSGLHLDRRRRPPGGASTCWTCCLVPGGAGRLVPHREPGRLRADGARLRPSRRGQVCAVEVAIADTRARGCAGSSVGGHAGAAVDTLAVRLHIAAYLVCVLPPHAVRTCRLPQVCSRGGRERGARRWSRWCGCSSAGWPRCRSWLVLLVLVDFGGLGRHGRARPRGLFSCVYALLCVCLGEGWVGQAAPRGICGAQRAAPRHLGHNGHLLRLGRLRRRRRAHPLCRGSLAGALPLCVVVVGGRGACLSRFGALVSLPVLLAITITVAILALGAARLFFAAAVVGVGRAHGFGGRYVCRFSV